MTLPFGLTERIEALPVRSRRCETGYVSAGGGIVREPIEAIISEALRDVYDPCCKDKGISVVDMGLLHRA